MKKHEVRYSDDFTKEITPDVKRFNFGWMNNYFEIDLNEMNANTVREFMENLIAHAHPIKNKPRSNDKETKKTEDLKPIREWLQREGYPVGNQGRIKQRYLDAYREAHK